MENGRDITQEWTDECYNNYYNETNYDAYYEHWAEEEDRYYE